MGMRIQSKRFSVFSNVYTEHEEKTRKKMTRMRTDNRIELIKSTRNVSIIIFVMFGFFITELITVMLV